MGEKANPEREAPRGHAMRSAPIFAAGGTNKLEWRPLAASGNGRPSPNRKNKNCARSGFHDHWRDQREASGIERGRGAVKEPHSGFNSQSRIGSLHVKRVCGPDPQHISI